MFFSCAICRENTPITFCEIHHIVPQSAGGKDFNEDGSKNTIKICTSCHSAIHNLAVLMRGKNRGTTEDVLNSYTKSHSAKAKLVELTREINKAFFLKKENQLNLGDKLEPISIRLPMSLKRKLKVLANEHRNPKTGRKLGVARYIEQLLISHLTQHFPHKPPKNKG